MLCLPLPLLLSLASCIVSVSHSWPRVVSRLPGRQGTTEGESPTGSDAALQYIIDETTPLLLAKLVADGDSPVGPAIGGMPAGPAKAKVAAVKRFQAAAKQESVDLHKVEVVK